MKRRAVLAMENAEFDEMTRFSPFSAPAKAILLPIVDIHSLRASNQAYLVIAQPEITRESGAGRPSDHKQSRAEGSREPKPQVPGNAAIRHRVFRTLSLAAKMPPDPSPPEETLCPFMRSVPTRPRLPTTRCNTVQPVPPTADRAGNASVHLTFEHNAVRCPATQATEIRVNLAVLIARIHQRIHTHLRIGRTFDDADGA